MQNIRASCFSKLFYWISLGLALLFLAYAILCSPKSLKGDFSSFWLGAWWIREKPAEVPVLYYPFESEGMPNLRIWAMIRKASSEFFRPWYDWGRKQGFEEPKFYIYPPVFAIVFVPLTILPLKVAILFWNLINALGLILALWMFAVFLKSPDISSEKWLTALFAIFFVSYPVIWSLDLGQNSLLLFAGWVLFFIFVCQKEQVKAGIVLGLLISIKINPVIFLPWLLWRHYFRSVLVCAVTLLLLSLLSFTVAGFENIKIYFSHLFPLLSTGTHFYENQSLLGVLLRWKNPGQFITATPGMAESSPGFLYPLLGVGLLGMEMIGILKWSCLSPLRTGIEFLSWTTWLSIVSPVTWSHHQVILLMIPFFLAKEYLDHRIWMGRMLLFGLILSCFLISIPSFPVDWLQTHPCPLWVSIHFWGAVFLWGILQVLKFRSLNEVESSISSAMRS